MKTLKLTKLGYEQRWQSDVDELVDMMSRYGYCVSQLEMFAAWKDFSKRCGAEWVYPQSRQSDEGTVNMLKKDYFEEIK